MPTATKIEWADATTNTAVGCSHCSPGCDNCYAERFAHRLSKHPVAKKVYAGVVDERGKWTGKINSNFSEKMYPHRVPGKGKRVFVGSMTDIFHPNYPAENRDELFASILADYIFANGHGHTFIILTKRPQAMEEYFAASPETLLRRWGKAGNGWIIVGDGDSESFEEYADAETIPQEMTSPRSNLRQDYLWPLPNLWLGVTVCNRDELWKTETLKKIQAARRVVSFEPFLGEVGNVLPHLGHWTRPDGSGSWFSPVPGKEYHKQIDWVIAGGETGPGARPMHPDWVRSLRDQCQSAGVPFFFKSWGEWGFAGADATHALTSDGELRKISRGDDALGDWPCSHVGKKRAGRLLDGREWNEIPEVSK